MTGLPVPAIRAVRLRFGDDADAVMTLRAAHKTVRPFGTQYSVDEEIVDSAELHRMAAAENARRDAKAKRTKRKTASGNPPLGKGEGTAGRADGPGSALAANSDATPPGCVDDGSGFTPPDPVVPPRATSQTEGAVTPTVEPAPTTGIRPALCGCGNPRAHFGRCWFRRGYAGPKNKSTARSAFKPTCAKCGGPRSKWSRTFCRGCYTSGPKRAPPKFAGHEQRIKDLEVAVAELERDFELAGLRRGGETR